MSEPVSPPLPDWWPDLFPPPFVVVPTDSPVWPDDEATRQLALSLGQAHAVALAAVDRLAADNGGGVLGIARGMLDDHQRLGYLTVADRARLLACFEAFAGGGAGATRADRLSAVAVIQRQFDEATADPYSSPFALSVLSVAVSGASRLLQSDSPSVPLVGAADAVAGLFGGGIPGMVVASYVAAHVDVHVTFS